MKKILLIGLVVLSLASCKKDEEPVTTGTLSGTVTNASGAVLADVLIVVYDANTNSPAGANVKTDAEGNYTIELEPGNYYIKVFKQGFESIPPKGVTAIPFQIDLGITESRSFEMFVTTVSGGWVTGKVTDGANAVANVLVVASDAAGESFSAISDTEGVYTIFNVPAGNYGVMGWAATYNSDEKAASVTADAETGAVDLTLTAGAAGVVSGTVRHLATGNIDVDVALIHPLSKESIPGLSSFTVADNYEIPGVPDGIYLARATFENDNRVMDPDRITKFGEPEVAISGGNTVTIDFDVTNSVTLNAPTNEASTTIPFETTSTAPTFEWTPYASTSDYVIEVMDAATGQVVWGGFSHQQGVIGKNYTIGGGATSAVYNEDNSASVATLVPGRIYRWRIYASKDDAKSAVGWNLISASEDQMGLIKIVQ